MIIAYGTNRTLIILSRGWRYSPSGGWEKYFLPVSDTCVDRYGPSKPWTGVSFLQSPTSKPWTCLSIDPSPESLPSKDVFVGQLPAIFYCSLLKICPPFYDKSSSDYSVQNNESLRGHCTNEGKVRKWNKKERKDVI